MSTSSLRSLSALATLALPFLGAGGCILVINTKGGDSGSGPGGGGGGGYPPPPETGWVDDTGGVACTDMAAASVMVSVVDPSGVPLPGATVTYTTPGSDVPVNAECTDASCTQWVAGWEVGGDITVTASYNTETADDPCCWYEDSVSQTVTVPYTADGCHVMTQSLTLTLNPTHEVCADSTTAEPNGGCG